MKRYLLCLAALTIAVPFAAPVAAQDNRPELALQIGHVAQVRAMALSPDGKVFASGGLDETAKLWDAASGALLASLPHRVSVLAVAFTESNTLTTAAGDGSVRVWDIGSGALRSQRAGQGRTASAAAFSAGGKLVAFAPAPAANADPDEKDNAQYQITVFDTASGERRAVLDGHPTSVLALAFSPDSKRMLSSSAAFREKPASEEFAAPSGDVRVWDIGEKELVRTLRGHALSVHNVAWSQDGAKFVSVGESGTAVIWDAKTFAKLDELNISEGKGRAISAEFSRDGRELAAGWLGGARLWNIAAKEPAALWSIKDEEPVTGLAFLPDGRVAAGGRDGEVQLLAAKDGVSAETEARVLPLSAARVSPDGNFIASACSNGAINLWNARKGALQRAWRAHDGVVRDLAFSPDGTLLATAGNDRAVRLWDVPSGKLRRAITDFSGPVTALAFSPDGKTLAAGGQRGEGFASVSLWSVGDGKLTQNLTESQGQIFTLAYAPDGSLAAATGRGDSWGQILVWDAAGKLTMRNFLRGARSASVSPDGKKLIAGGAFMEEEDGFASSGDVMQVWNMRAGEMSREIVKKMPEARILSTAFSADSSTMACASRNGVIRTWVDDKPTHTMSGHEGAVRSIAFLPGQDKALVSAGLDGTVRIWDAGTGRLRASLMVLPDDDDNNELPIGRTLSPDWLALTPEGYYYGSPGADRYVQWRVGTDVFTVDAFEERFARQNIVVAAIGGQAPASTPADAAINQQFEAGKAIPPQVSIVAPKAGQPASEPLTVKINASDDTDVKNVQLTVNGRPLPGQASDAAVAAVLKAGAKPLEVGAKAIEMGAKAIELGAKAIEMGAKPLEVGAKAVPSAHRMNWDFDVPLPLPPADGGGVTVKVTVTDNDGLQGFDEIRLARSKDGAKIGTGVLRVLSIGVSNYANTAYNLKYAAADATAFAGLWPQQQGQLFGKVEVSSLTNAQATSAKIAEAIKNIAGSAGRDDIVLIFLSGHGVQKTDNEFYFASQDINLDNMAATAVPWTVFQDALGKSKARRVVLFLDACHSGGALGGRQAGNESMAEQLVKNAGAVVFTSSLGSQRSYEVDQFKQGAFTQALIEGIGHGKADLDAGAGKNGIINVEELLTYLRARVPILTDDAQIPACPLLRDFGEPFPLARVK